ncbi:pyridoxamine 5'-phosphate oxidase family protein [Jannaschia seohaensis]|uniref:Pyridoxamine 5'-phosphate oxidase n=1 Tax=Jannaschia seohaensis TaxID=475081 RepID=A0A2Y9C3Y0_9RHOB|nr:pyridoxamine 5'-phosphate oxidase family protein [Jannaschia seohaensis]PWJ22335.1 pyridoxamine 5'-phosphate oxidase [Jannaschia seohaensis]SSA38613.1 Pyridoxamine 5'-phosphate oxidase [Jannaschia seohaensis]
MSDPWTELERLRAHLWMRLARGAAEPRDPFRFVALATSGADGAEARMVGLRRASAAARIVEIHTDPRTAKIAALRRDPRGALLFWDPDTQEQLRLSVQFEIAFAPEDRWAKVPEAARLNYGTDPAPGTPLSEPEDLRRTPDIARFAALPGEVTRMDAVSLAHDPHRRAVFDGPDLTGRWVAP